MPGLVGRYLNIVKNTDKNIPFAPKHKVKGSLIANINDFTTVLRGNYSEKYFEDSSNERQLDAYFVADLRLSYQWKPFDMYLEVKNLFDKQYEEKIGYPAWDRRVFLGCVFSF
jgi:outer membrane cobalamin receptor